MAVADSGVRHHRRSDDEQNARFDHLRETNGTKPHPGTLLTLAMLAVAVLSGTLAFFMRESMNDIKVAAFTAKQSSSDNATEVALLKAGLARVEADLKELKEGQKLLLAQMNKK